MNTSFVKAGTVKDFPKNQTKEVVIDGNSICVANDNGCLTAFNNTCTHAAAQLSDCDIHEGQITCPLHGARFDVQSGAAKRLPATEPLKMNEVKVEGQDVFIKLNEE